MKIVLIKDNFGLIRPDTNESNKNKYIFHHCSNGATAVTTADYDYVLCLLELHGLVVELKTLISE